MINKKNAIKDQKNPVFIVYGSVWGKYIRDSESLRGGSIKYTLECVNSNGEKALGNDWTLDKNNRDKYTYNDPMDALNDMVKQAKYYGYELKIEYMVT
jgi:hypothetical protein